MEEDHIHCMACVNQRCTVRPEPGISCDLITCPQVCGAVFHSCKGGEHHLMCPLLKVPCLNSGYGCPVMLVRNQMYGHLEVCPAGLVCCTMEWNRWPVSCLNYTSYENLSCGVEDVEQLDMALALQDQRTLLESHKVIAMAPTAEGMPHVLVSKENRPVESALPTSASSSAKEKIVSGINGLKEEHFSKLYEATVETARSLAAALDFVSSVNSVHSSTVSAAAVQESIPSSNGELQNGLEDTALVVTEGLSKRELEKSVCSNCLNGNVAPKGTDQKILSSINRLESGPTGAFQETAVEVDDINAGITQEPVTHEMISPIRITQGVAQRADPVVLEDRGQALLESHRSKQKFHNYQAFRDQSQCSLPNGHIGFLPDKSLCRVQPKMEDKAVDTSDLQQDDDPVGLGDIDLITAALLFCLEESRECRRISDTVYVDGHCVDFGTQTFCFPAAILVTNTRVGDMASASACEHAAPQLSYPSPFHTLRLGFVLGAQNVESTYRHMFPFICGQSFRRDQFSSHFTNVHGDIHAGLNGWMVHRCPLAYYGCTFSQRRLYPSTQGAKVVHDRHLRSFGVQPCPRAKLPNESQSDQLSGLPIEILWHIAGFLDSFSLCQLSLVSRTMREVCASLLKTRGVVELQWEQRRGPDAHGTVSWQVKNRVWRFTTAFSPVSSWGFRDLPSMSDHLKKCHFNVVEHKTEPIPLPAMCPTRDGHSLRRVLRHINT